MFIMLTTISLHLGGISNYVVEIEGKKSERKREREGERKGIEKKSDLSPVLKSGSPHRAKGHSIS